MGISEVYKCDDDPRLKIPGLRDILTQCGSDDFRGGVGLFIKDSIKCVMICV